MSCLFCESNFHISQFCHVHKTANERLAVANTKKLCILCFKTVAAQHKRSCFQRCHTCYKNDHHTFLCKSNGIQLFVPAIDKNLLPRFIQIFDPIEQFQLLFYSNPANVKLKWIRVLNEPDAYKSAIFPPYIKYAIYKYHTFTANDRSIFDKIKYGILYVYSKIVILRNLQLSAEEFLLLLSSKTFELSCYSVYVTSRVSFAEIVLKTRNLKKLELNDTNIIIKNTWPNTLLKNINGKSFRSLRMTINHVDFETKALAEFMKNQESIHFYLDIDASLSYQEVQEAMKENLEKHFSRLQKASSESRWICIRFIERNEDMPKIIHSLGTYTL